MLDNLCSWEVLEAGTILCQDLKQISRWRKGLYYARIWSKFHVGGRDCIMPRFEANFMLEVGTVLCQDLKQISRWRQELYYARIWSKFHVGGRNYIMPIFEANFTLEAGTVLCQDELDPRFLWVGRSIKYYLRWQINKQHNPAVSQILFRKLAE
jgi:hypothetical protein